MFIKKVLKVKMIAIIFASNCFADEFRNKWERLNFIIGSEKRILDNEFYLEGENGSGMSVPFFDGFLLTTPVTDYCYHPAKYLFLKKHLKLSDNVNLNECEDYRQFKTKFKFNDLYIAYASNLIGSPVSAFGHLFLVMKRREEFNYDDYVIQFNAETSVKDGFISYAFKGLTGGYRGYFYNIPLFEKIYEYTRTEQRNIYLSKLGLDKTQKEFLLAMLFELQSASFEYHFLNYNCSSYIDVVLANVIGKTINSNYLYSLPSEIFIKYSNTKKIKKLPSVFSLIQILERELSLKKNQELKEELASNKSVTDSYVKSKKLLYHYNDYMFLAENNSMVERMTSESIPEEYLKTINQTKEVPSSGSEFSFFFHIEDNKDEFASLQFRPALNDLQDNNYNYDQYVATEIINTRINYKEDKFEVEKFDLISTSQMQHYSSVYSNLSHKSYLGFNRDYSEALNFNAFYGKGFSLFYKGHFASLIPTIGITEYENVYRLNTQIQMQAFLHISSNLSILGEYKVHIHEADSLEFFDLNINYKQSNRFNFGLIANKSYNKEWLFSLYVSNSLF